MSLWYFILLGTRLKDIYTTGFISTILQVLFQLEFPQNVISKEITSPKVPICPIFEKMK